ncbi:Cullin binding-domain-containing protein [Massariosphaeria phaeospora]|uniref:Defective in cullin neddylation protein n=1 Tax=Massariosphaeria phaeospora TaxID=100035 RepID=A0A7C8MF63_9PLEO|nr:Cullin binding-domain-containing protein [Massariosphaeria phaeospora]
MPPAHTAQQKAAISGFQNFTSVDRNTALRFLKSNGWDTQTAVNSYFNNGGGGSAAPSAAKTNLGKMFDKYREDVANSPDTVGAEGLMRYLSDAKVDLEGLETLAVLEIIQAPTMGEVTREGFVDGWSILSCDSIDKQKTYIKNLKQTLPSNKEQYAKVYKHTFQLAKSPTQKGVPLDMAVTYWDLLFTSPLSAVKWTTDNTPWSAWWVEYLNSSWKKAVNKDMWNETLKFAQMTLEDEVMSFWNEEASWPSVIDDFVGWVKEKRGDVPAETMEE